MVRPLFILAILAFSVSAFAGPMGGYSTTTTTTTTTTMTVEEAALMNTTLLGDKVLARDVVCRSRWGTPMLPDGKGSYSLVQRLNARYIAQSKVIPPVSIPPLANYIPYRPDLNKPAVVITPAQQ